MTNLQTTYHFIKYFNTANELVYKYKNRTLSNRLKQHAEAGHTAHRLSLQHYGNVNTPRNFTRPLHSGTGVSDTRSRQTTGLFFSMKDSRPVSCLNSNKSSDILHVISLD